MPLYLFWSAVKNLSRIDAEKRIGDLRISNASQSKEGSEEVYKDLKLAVGTTLVLEDVAPEKDAFKKLEALISG